MNWNKELAAHILRSRFHCGLLTKHHSPNTTHQTPHTKPHTLLPPMPASAEAVADILDQCRIAAEANRACAARRGNVIQLAPDDAADVMIVADLHGNRLNYAKLLAIADLANQ